MVDIKLPADVVRRRRAYDDYSEEFISLEDAETKVNATGQHRGTTVKFSDDGKKWVEAWIPTLEGDGDAAELRTHPEYARAIVKRKMSDGDVVPTKVVVRWVEFVPDVDDENRPFWDSKPTVMLGKVAKVSGFRGGFRDVIGNRYEPAEKHAAPKPHPPKVVAS